MKPLDGVKVLDLSRVLAGPWATQLLADFGADVVKVEQPGRGDDTRSWGPPWAEGPSGDRMSAYFMAANRGKRSVAIDIARPEGADIVRRMAERSDVMVENFKVGGLAKYSLDAATLRKANPRLIVASITGFGQTGPYAHRAGYDFIIQGMGGMMSITGLPDGAPGGGPLRSGVAVADLFTGMYTAFAVMAALRERDRTGEGSHIDMALLDVQVAMLANQGMNCLVAEKSPGRQGNAHPNIVPYQTFVVADGEIVLAVGNDDQFRRLADILGRPDLAMDERYAKNEARVVNRASLVPILARIFLKKDRETWLRALEEQSVPAGPINTISQAFDDPQVVSRGMVCHLDSVVMGRVAAIRNPIRIDGVQCSSEVAPPMIGNDTQSALQNLGIDEAEVADLRREAVVDY